MANEFKVKKGLIVQGSGSTVLDIQGSQGQLFSVTDDLTGTLFTVSDISGIPIMEVDASGATTFDGSVELTETAATTDTDKFAVLDSGVVKYRTGAEVLSDIGGQASITNPVTGTGTTNYVSKWTGTNTQGKSLIFDNGTNVGIGTNTPDAKLDITYSTADIGTIVGNTTHNSIFQIKTAAAGKNSEIWFGDSADGDVGKIDYDHNNNSLAITTNTSEALRIDSTGNVGIGTSSPNSKLQISSGNNSNTQLLIGESSTYGTPSARFVTAPINYMGLGFTSGSVIGNEVLDAISIQRTGNVGIGTTSPSTALDVVGKISLNDGGRSVYVGENAGLNDDGSNNYNVGLGYGSLQNNTTGFQNIATGYFAGRLDSSSNPNNGSRNSLFIGFDSRPLGQGEINQIVIGYEATGLGSNTVVLGNNSIVTTALKGNVGIGTSSPSEKLSVVGKIDLNDGGNSIFIGEGAGLNDDTTDNQNVGIGYQSLYSNTTGYNNLAIGYGSLCSNTTGIINLAIGNRSLGGNTTGFGNLAIGEITLASNTTGKNNLAVGKESLCSNSTGNNNTAIGGSTLSGNTTGYSNLAIGFTAGLFTNSFGSNQTSNNSVYLGYDTKAGASGNTNEIVIGASAQGQGSNSAILGNSSITKTILNGNVGIGTTNPQSPLHVYDGSNGITLGDPEYGDGIQIKEITGGLTITEVNEFGSGDIFRIDNDGNVGIGTSDPSSNLHISSTTTSPSIIVEHDVGLASTTLQLSSEAIGVGSVIQTSSGYSTVFKIGTSEKMRVNPDGNIGIGTSTPDTRLHVRETTLGETVMTIQANESISAGVGFIDFKDNGGSTVGSITYDGMSSTNYNTSSDYRLKENVVKIDGALERLKLLKPVNFNFINSPERIVDGFIAHEVKEVIPEAITGVKDELDKYGKPKYQGIDQSKIVPLLTAALQEAVDKISKLEERIQILEN